MLAYDWNFLGLSTETKPLSGEKVVDGSTYYECDTSTFFIYYQGEWYQQTFVTEDGINFWLYKTLMKKMFGKWFDSNISLAKIIKPTTGTEIEFSTNLPAQITDLIGYGNISQITDPAPTPDEPQTITVVTGEQTVVTDEIQEFTIDLGSIELCKFGDYQDYIYKSGDDWYTHKEIEKYTFTGSENWGSVSYGTNSWTLNNVVTFSFDANKIQIISNIAAGIAQVDRNTAGDYVMYSGSNAGFTFRNTSFTSKSEIQAATTDNYIYHALATPTDTKITDNTLISNLNSLLNYIFPVGEHQVVITADTLPMALKLTITEKE